MRILLAPDSYKECMDAACVAAAMADAVRKVRPEWETAHRFHIEVKRNNNVSLDQIGFTYAK